MAETERIKIARKKRHLALEILKSAPDIPNKQLNEKVAAKYGTALTSHTVCDLRCEARGIEHVKLPHGGRRKKKVAKRRVVKRATKRRVAKRTMPQPNTQMVSQTVEVLEAMGGKRVSAGVQDLVRTLLQMMRSQGVDRLIINADGTGEAIHKRTISFVLGDK